jgi:flavin reductase (DIM6/NTAB) family NADH-FMN oxidoreductase RutF
VVEPFIEGMRQLAAGVSVVTAGVAGDRNGMTASAVCSLSVDPPSLVACLSRAAGTCSRVAESGTFCVNVLGRHHEELAQVFAGRGGVTGEARFTTGAWRRGVLGVPVLDDALVAFECEVTAIHDHATHGIVVGLVREVHMAPDATQAPLVYHDRSFHSVA